MKQAILIVLLILPIVHAIDKITTSHTRIEIDKSIAHITTDLNVLADNNIGNFILILTQQPTNVKITINNKKVTCTIQTQFASCGNLTPGSHNVSISYASKYPLAQVSGNTIIRYTDRLPFPAQRQQVTLTLPIGYIIPREQDKDESFYLSPTPKEVYSDGQRILLRWEQEGQELPISAVTKNVLTPPWIWITATILLSLTTAGTVLYFLFRKQKTESTLTQTETKDYVIIPQLIDNEQRIVNYLKESGEVWQKQIQQATGFSKAKVSRIIRNLESREVITKTPYGNTNKIMLKNQMQNEPNSKQKNKSPENISE